MGLCDWRIVDGCVGVGKVIMASSKRRISMVVSCGNVTNIYGNIGSGGFGNLLSRESLDVGT